MAFLHGLLNKIFGFHGIPHTNFASGLSFSWLPPVILVWVTRSNCASAGTVLMVLLKPLGTTHGVLIRPITGHGGFWTNSTKLKTLTICWCSETKWWCFGGFRLSTGNCTHGSKTWVISQLIPCCSRWFPTIGSKCKGKSSAGSRQDRPQIESAIKLLG